jgi:flagellar basal body rod protein FlgG
MAGGAYVALSGLRARSEHLDRLAADIANAATSGYKAERGTTAAAERLTFNRALESAIDVAHGPTTVDMRDGAITPTGRDLDFALRGGGFFVVDTPGGPRYTRNGHFERGADGMLATADGDIVQGEGGPIQLGTGALSVGEDGTIRTGATVAGKLKVVDFTDASVLAREGSARFNAGGVTPVAMAAPRVQAGALEKSNVSLVERIAEMTETSRTFEALQRGVSLIMNDMDGKAITELGRR